MQASTIRRYLSVGITLLAIFAIFFYFSDIVTWIVLAWIVSLIGAPIMSLLGRIKIGKWQMGNSGKAAITLLIFCVIIGFFVALFVPVIVQQGRNLASVNYAKVMEGLEEPISHFYGNLAEWGFVEEIPDFSDDSTQTKPSTDSSQLIISSDSTAELNLKLNGQELVTTSTIQIDSLIRASGDTVTRTNIELKINLPPELLAENNKEAEAIFDSTAMVNPNDGPIERLQKKAFTYINPSGLIANTFSTILGWLGNLFILITSVLFIAFFFLQEERLFSNLIKAPFSDEYGAKIDKMLFLIRKMLIRYFEGILGQVTLVSLYLWLLLWIVGAPNAFLIAFFAAIINVIPYLGPVLGLVFGVIVCICSSLDMDFYAHTMPLLLKVTLVFASMQALDNFLLQPLIFSKSVKAHPLEIFIAIIIGSKLGGIPGMVAAIPLYTIIRVVASVFLSEFKIVKSLTGQLGFMPNWSDGGGDEAAVPEDDRQMDSDDQLDDGWHS